MKRTLIIAAMVLSPVAAFAAGESSKPAKPVACQSFTTAKTVDGAEIGICGATREGGKATFLRSFAVATVVDPSTDKPVRVLVGFR